MITKICLKAGQMENVNNVLYENYDFVESKQKHGPFLEENQTKLRSQQRFKSYRHEQWNKFLVSAILNNAENQKELVMKQKWTECMK